jgi:hypothetical protein
MLGHGDSLSIGARLAPLAARHAFTAPRSGCGCPVSSLPSRQQQHPLMSETYPTSRHDYFAANAPTEIPGWFQPDMAHLPLPEKPENVTRDGFGQYTGSAYEAWREAVAQVEDQRAEYRYFMWRWYFAEKMIEHKGKGAKPMQISAEALREANRL